MTLFPNIDDEIKDITFINDIKSIAVIGISKKRDFFFLRNHYLSFKGNVYAVHPEIKEIQDFPKENIYDSILSIPEPVDFAFIAVPAKIVPKVIGECTEKGVKLVTIFTSNFSDAGTEEGLKLEKEVLKQAQGKLRILGPNGLGLFYPKIGMAWRPEFPTIPGNIGFIAQSGGICNIAIYSSIDLGINFSKVFSFGNGLDLDFVDLLYFLINDQETKIILCYLEGIKKGRVNDLKEILKNNKKPIIFLKGGKSNVGAEAAKTHTASISGDNIIWSNFLKQYNIIEVESLEQLLNTALLLDCYGTSIVENIAILSISGGYGVVLTDILENYGLNIPRFSQQIQEKLSDKFFMVGTSSRNPLDLAAQFFAIDIVHEIVDLVLSDEKIHALVMDLPGFYLSIPPRHRDKSGTFQNQVINMFKLAHKYKKPIFLIIQHSTRTIKIGDFIQQIKESKIPIFGDPLEFVPLLPKISSHFNQNDHKN